MGYLLGIDVGTGGTRAILVDPATGDVIAGSTDEYPMYTPQPQWAEQDPADWWRATRNAIQGAIAQAGIRAEDIQGIGLTGQMHGIVLLDENDEVLRSSIIWCDQRSQAQCDWITERVGAERLIELTSNPALTGFSAPKLLWVRDHQPDIYAKVRTVLLPKDFIRFKLTGERASEVSDASGTLLFDVTHRRWSQKMLDALDIDPTWLPKVYESPEVTGYVTAQAAKLTGLKEGTPVVGGGGDQAAGAVGNGIVRSGIVSCTVGTSGVVFAYMEQPKLDPKGRVHTFCHAVPGAWHVMGVTQGAGLSLRWFRDRFGGMEQALAPELGVDPYDIIVDEAQRSPAGCEGLIFLPYLMGERTPHLDPDAKGVFFGLTARHTRGDVIRSILEGVAYSLRDSFEILREMSVPVEQVRASGGGARSALWRQIQADVYNKELVTINATEGPAYGAALLAGVGTGTWKTVPEACDATIRIVGRTRPNPDDVSVYNAYYPIYRSLYKSLKPAYDQVAEVIRTYTK
ncbi:MAG: xylulokinase [Anaerolineae bacterium]|nr:xylulokinase [Anaerolineae bacterium]